MKVAELLELHHHMITLAALTSKPNWEGDEDEFGRSQTGKAKAIGIAQWRDAFRVAREVGIALPHLSAPIPVSDPNGFVGLLWGNDSTWLQVRINAAVDGSRITWTVRRDGMDTSHAANSLRPLVESLRATFPRPLVVV